jgi:hypothetical protein
MASGTDGSFQLELAGGRVAGSRAFADFSYHDELESLLMTPGLDRARLISERFSDDEDVFLPALNLDGWYRS